MTSLGWVANTLLACIGALVFFCFSLYSLFPRKKRFFSRWWDWSRVVHFYGATLLTEALGSSFSACGVAPRLTNSSGGLLTPSDPSLFQFPPCVFIPFSLLFVLTRTYPAFFVEDCFFAALYFPGLVNTPGPFRHPPPSTPHPTIFLSFSGNLLKRPFAPLMPCATCCLTIFFKALRLTFWRFPSL